MDVPPFALQVPISLKWTGCFHRYPPVLSTSEQNPTFYKSQPAWDLESLTQLEFQHQSASYTQTSLKQA
jgi:hypothetical protein